MKLKIGKEVFTGPIVSGGKEGKIILTLRQTPDGLEMVFEHPQIDQSKSWKVEVGDGEREIRFNDGREPSRADKERTKVRFSNEKGFVMMMGLLFY